MKETEFITSELTKNVERLKREVRNETLEEIAYFLYEKAENKIRLLRTIESQRIFALSQGERFVALNDKRQRLYAQSFLLENAAGEIYHLQNFKS